MPTVRAPFRSVSRSRNAVENDRARLHPPSHRSASPTDAPTTVLDLAALVAERNATRPQHCGPAPRRRRSRATDAAVRDARRHGIAAAGVAAAALAVVAPAALQAPADGALATQDAALALSSQSSRLAAAPAVAPVVVAAAAPATGDPATADLFKAGDRVRRQSEQAAADRTRAAQATQAAEKARAEQAAAAEKATRITSCGADSNYGGVADSVQTVGNALECVFPGHDLGGIGSRSGASDHPSGYALDVMTRDGDAIADCVMDNAGALGVSYAIWDQRINTGSGWKGMEDRGGDTANHRDHVHISFERGAEPDVSALRSCT
ncbi:hypothetical protein [Actinomycetospora atypica]|uniref:ARB-07466-like C-terminal domain-containing protein n=1 Tax=Actinomycetospora atypica TaxID=1290095 RepID=A0ABV9YT00_9PSEU